MGNENLPSVKSSISLLGTVVNGNQVDIIITNLEVEAQFGHQRDECAAILFGERAHQANSQTEKTSSLILYHANILLFRGTNIGISPINLKSLPMMQSNHFGQKVLSG